MQANAVKLTKKSKVFQTLYNRAGEERNLLKKMVDSKESMMSDENKASFIETACLLHAKMINLQNSKEDGSKYFFNKFLASMQDVKDLVGTCNFLLKDLPEPIQFSFEFFPGPIEEAEKAQQLLEEEEKRQKYLRDAHERRAPLGFDSPTIRNHFPTFLRYIICKKLSQEQAQAKAQAEAEAERKPAHSPHPDKGSGVVKCTTDRGGIIYFKSDDEIRQLVSDELKSNKVIRQVVDCRRCMQITGSGCKTCSALSMLFQMSKDHVGFINGTAFVSSDTVKSFVLEVMIDDTFKNLHGVCLELYLNDILKTSSKTFNEVTKPNILAAFNNPFGDLAKELLGAFSDYTDPFTDEQVQEMSERYKKLFETWKTNFLNAELDSQYIPGKLKKQVKESNWSNIQFPRQDD